MIDLSFGWGFLIGVIGCFLYLTVVGMIAEWEIRRKMEHNKKHWQEVGEP